MRLEKCTPVPFDDFTQNMFTYFLTYAEEIGCMYQTLDGLCIVSFGPFLYVVQMGIFLTITSKQNPQMPTLIICCMKGITCCQRLFKAI